VSDVTRILEAAQQGDPTAAEQLLPLVYEELRRLAAQKMARESPGHTLQPTALVHEAWLRLTGNSNQKWDGRSHFFGAAAEAMRRILIDRARRKQAQRHGGGELPVVLDQVEIAAPEKDEDWLRLNEALEQFEMRDKQKAELIKLRYFVGLTLEEAAELLGISVPTASRWWSYSRAWLAEAMESQPKD
jgi:RNA polymerase sigma factor (TIGR02999 family)